MILDELWERAPPCTISFVVKALPASLPPRRRDNHTAPTRLASTPYGARSLSPGKTRDEAAAKCLMRRVLHFANAATAV